MEGFDTGFFFDLRTGETDVQDLWRSVMERDVPAAVSSVTLFELTRHGLLRRLDPEFTTAVVERAGVAFEQADIDPPDVLVRAARITHGMGLPWRMPSLRPPWSTGAATACTRVTVILRTTRGRWTLCFSENGLCYGVRYV